MSELNNHVILSHLDSPARILIWSVGQALTCAAPFAIGLITEKFVLGAIFSVISVSCFKWIRKRFGKGKLRSIMYWYLPTSPKQIKRGVPPSHVRFWTT